MYIWYDDRFTQMKRSNAHEVTLRAVLGMLFMYLCPHLVRRQTLKSLRASRALQYVCVVANVDISNYQNKHAPILIALPHTYVRKPRQRLVLWNKAKPILITYREETKQPRRPIAGLAVPWVLSSAESWSDIYTGHTSCLMVTPCLHRMRAALRHKIL